MKREKRKRSEKGRKGWKGRAEGIRNDGENFWN